MDNRLNMKLNTALDINFMNVHTYEYICILNIFVYI